VARKRGLGMGAFFTQRSDGPTIPKRPQEISRVRTTIRLAREEADLLDLLRMRRRRQRGRSVTYGDVLGEAVRRLAREEGIGGDGKA